MNATTKSNLESALTAVEDAGIREHLAQSFYLLDPIQFAKLLISLDLPDRVKADLLRLKVELPPAYKGEDFEALLHRSMEKWWQKMIDDCAAAEARMGVDCGQF